MKKCAFILMVLVANTVYAQWCGYYTPYTGNAYVDARIMASEYRLMQETYRLQQVLNHSTQLMQEQLQRNLSSMTYIPITPCGSYERVKQSCSECGGSGKRAKTVWMGSSGNRNVELTCSSCHGTGSVTVSQYVTD